MKLILIIMVPLIFIGCSSIYTVKDFSSKEKFYEDFNKSVKGKELKITLTNDSSFVSLQNAKIQNDSLVVVNYLLKTDKVKIQQKDIKKMMDFYDANSNHTIKIFLKNEKEIDVNNIKYLPDSSLLVKMTEIDTTFKFIPIKKIKSIGYKNNWLGILFGFPVGAVSGLVVGATGLIPIYESRDEAGQHRRDIDYFATMLYGTVSGAFIGSVIGWLVGYNYTYQFNN